MRKLAIALDVLAGLIVGGVLAFSTAILLIAAQVHGIETTVNGWTNTMTCGKASNGVLVRAACAQAYFAVNLPDEAVYFLRGRRSRASIATSCTFQLASSRPTRASGR